MTSSLKPQQENEASPGLWKIAGVVLLGPLMTSLDSTVVNVSLSSLGRELHVPIATLQWVITGYLLALALMLPLSGWIVDRLGAKRLYLGSFFLFTLSSLLCGLSNSAAALISSRILQGVAGGLLAPMAQMMTARIAGKKIARVLSLMVLPVLLGPICGPSLAGFILQQASWRWIFFINLPIGLLALVLAVWILPQDTISTQRRAFDGKGFLLVSPGLVLILYGLEALSSNHGAKLPYLLLIVFSLSLLMLFRRHAKRLGEKALIDLALFKDKGFTASARTQLLANAISFGGQMMLPLYLLTVRQVSPSQAGLLLMPSGLGMLCTYPFIGFLTERFGSRTISTAGATLAFFATAPFALAGTLTLSSWMLTVLLFVRGMGLSAIGIPSVAAAYASIPRESIPAATTAINIVQRVGGPISTTLLAIALQLFTHTGAALVQAYSWTFALLAGFHLAAIAAALQLRRGAR